MDLQEAEEFANLIDDEGREQRERACKLFEDNR